MTEELYCPCCGAVFTPEQLTAPPFATCGSCKLSVIAKRRHAQAQAPVPAPPKPTEWPDGFVVEEVRKPLSMEPGDPYRTAGARPLRPGLTITWPTSGAAARWFLVVFNLFWWGFLSLFFVTGERHGAHDDRHFKNLIWLGLAAIAGLGALWMLLTAWLNRTRIHADGASLSRHIGPMPGVEDFVLPIDRITQLYTRRIEKVDRDGDVWIDYALFARDREGRDHKVVSLDLPGQAWWLEARLEHHLGIADHPVEGEHLPGAEHAPRRADA